MTGTTTPLLDSADALDALGICAIPVAEDGSKRPAVDWKKYQRRRPTAAERADWWADGRRTGIGIVCGAVSGGLEMTELEARAVQSGAVQAVAEMAAASGDLDLWQRLTTGGYVVRSASGGLHVFAFVTDFPVPGNTRLAATAAHEVLAETRGEGGFVVTAPSRGRVHATGGRWEPLCGSPATIPRITVEERERFHALLRALDERPVPEPAGVPLFQQPRLTSTTGGLSPGDDFAAKTSWDEILGHAGWRYVFSRGGVRYWRRPGKSTGISASTGYGTGDWLYVFTSSTELEPERTYTKFGAFAALRHGGDHKAAAADLSARGFGHRSERATPVAAGSTETYLPASVDLWDRRPVLRHLYAFARARGVAPFAVLGVALTRVAAAVPPGMVLPALVGGPGTLNLFVALVGPSGSGKGAAHTAAEDALNLSGWRDGITNDDQLFVTNVGSGEGILHAFAMWSKTEGVQQIRESVLFVVNEVDQLAAVGSRQGSTLMSKLREAYSGETLAFNYADPTKRLHVRRHHYRMALSIGVQPGRAAALFDDADGGTPQRFVWLPATDPEMPRDRPGEPEPWTVPVPGRPPTGRTEIAVCDAARDEITEAHWRRSKGEGDALDGHALYTRLKVAAALAVLDGHLGTDGVTVEDWSLAGDLMTVSDATRTGVQAELRRAATAANEARGKAEGVREIAKTDAVEAAAIQKASRAVLTALGKRPGEWMAGAELRRAVPSRVRSALDAALDALVLAGSIETEEITHGSQQGRRYRVRS